ncbi:BrnA antitoxin family protein [Paracoccus sp. (in: a-proteobacteria)]|uniref:BrnA antitoxin family protein n=2 Tax=Paracoccus sp. TaxID=267 RepID=UPI003A84D8D6
MTKEIFDPDRAAEKGYTRADWDAVDSPELTDEQLATARPFRKAHPELLSGMQEEEARRGRPPLENPKVSISARLDADLVAALRATGPGWQTRVNAILREALGL